MQDRAGEHRVRPSIDWLLDGQFASIRHGIARIDAEVQEGILQLPCINERRPQPCCSSSLHLDLGTHAAIDAREGADIVLSYLNEHDDARSTADWIEKAGCKVVVVAGDIRDEVHCNELVETAVSQLGGLDILVNNAAFQRTYDDIGDITADEWDATFRTNIYAPFFLSKAAVPHLKPGSSIINTTSIQSKSPSAMLLAYASTKGAISNFTAGLAQMLGERGIRVNAVAPGPIWTPLIPATMPNEKVEGFGTETPLGRVGQPAELAGAYVLLASEQGSYITGAVIPVTGGEPML